MRLNVDSVAGALVVLVGAGAMVAALRFPASTGAVHGPAMFPMMNGGLAVLLGGALLGIGLRRAPGGAPGSGSVRPMLGLLALTMVYAALMPWLGFVSSSALFLTLAIRLLGYPHGWRAGAVALSMAFAIYGLFAGVMKVPLPTGWLG